ncbi:hypothetical protein PR001_g25303 [Phytophthora rubi]|uniref:Uncharacterized protein n=1 Tax=Phytophthora rubi TaxID=129364 RepID=A0A6A3I9S0_9STRA|nr:hypothetical protein PR001_g25303 [Phytophthora rubi]
MSTETQIIVRAAPTPLGLLALPRHTPTRLLQAMKRKSLRRLLPRSTRAIRRKRKTPREGRGRSEEDARFQEAHGRGNQNEGEGEEDARLAEAPAEDEEGDRFFEACSVEALGEEARCQAASKKKGFAKEGPKTPKLLPKRTDVLLPGPPEESSSESSDTDTPNPGLIDDAGSAASRHSNAPRVSALLPARPDKANAATTQPQGRSPSPDPSLQVDYEESESDKDHEVGEDECSPPQIAVAQRVIHPGSPMSPKTVVAVERARALEASMSRRDDQPPAAQVPQVITNAGVDEEVPPELLQPENRQHLADRSRQEASQSVGTKRDREAHAPRTRKQLLALRYWTRDEYGEHLRQSRRPGPGAPQCDKCPVVLLLDSGLARQRNETEFEAWLHHLGYPEPEFLKSPFRIDWLAQRRRRFCMAKMIADDTWSNRFFDRHKSMPGVILEEVLQKIQKSWQSQPIEPKSVLSPVSADQVRGHTQKRPRGRRSPRGEPQAPTSYDYSGSPATLPEAVEPAAGVASDQDAQRRPTGSRSDQEGLLTAAESCQQLLDGQRTEMVALRVRVQDAEAHLEKFQDGRRDLDRLRDRVTMLTACGPDVRKARRTASGHARAWRGTLTGSAFCTIVWAAWTYRRDPA